MVQAGVVLCEGRPEMIDSEGRTPGALQVRLTLLCIILSAVEESLKGFGE